MGSKDTPFDAFEVYRMCFACGRAEKVDIQAEGTPQMVKDCEDCGSRMYTLQGVEAYFDRFFSDNMLSDTILDNMEFVDTPDLPETEFEIEIMDSRFRFRAEKDFIDRFRRCLSVSKRHALKALRTEADLVSRGWPSALMGVFRPRGELAGSLIESMFVHGRFTLEDARLFDAEIEIMLDDMSTVPVIRENGKTYHLKIKEGYESWLPEVLPRVGNDLGRKAACIASACTMGLESTVAADIDPGYVIKDDELQDVTQMIAMKTKAAFGDTCSMEITDDGRLVISAESHSTDDILRALASAGVIRPESVADGVVLADTRKYANKAIQEELKQATKTTLEPELRKGLKDVLGTLSKAAAKRDPGHFATLDDLKTIQYADAVAMVKELHDRGYLHAVIEGWSYDITDRGTAALRVYESTATEGDGPWIVLLIVDGTASSVTLAKTYGKVEDIRGAYAAVEKVIVKVIPVAQVLQDR